MHGNTLLNQSLEELYPGFQLDDWTSNDSALSAIVCNYIRDSAALEQQGRYLAEAICLDSFCTNGLIEGISQYIWQYVLHHHANDQPKRLAIEQLLQEASVLRANEDSKYLAHLLSKYQTEAGQPIATTNEAISLDAMKAVDRPQRFGDVVFLPRDAEVFVIGDTHGDLASTQKIIEQIESSGAMSRGAFVVFLGDYVNNGVKSWQNLVEILRFQHAHPDAVVLLSGNHEFKESYLTALSQYLNTHWERFGAEDLPPELQDRLPQFNNHYGHMRLDLVRSFGFEEAERLYSACFEWGLSLPSICVSGDLMISHSLGKSEGENVELSGLLHCKKNDEENLRQLGFEAWRSQRSSLHSALMNNRTISADLLSEFSRVLGVNKFVVGHCHYRSGDTLHYGDNSVTTIVSSSPFSPDSGHYMYQQMMVERGNKRHEENLKQNYATAGYLNFVDAQIHDENKTMTMIELD